MGYDYNSQTILKNQSMENPKIIKTKSIQQNNKVMNI